MTKPYEISRKLVWKAYQQVKANRGAAGIDNETIQAYEKDLKDNLYKLWNRMSSGSYFPPPVKGVEIPKKTGGRFMSIEMTLFFEKKYSLFVRVQHHFPVNVLLSCRS
jgi:RNA-directed DNA polymerase